MLKLHPQHKSDIIDMAVVIQHMTERAVLCRRFLDVDADPDDGRWFPVSLVELADNGHGVHTLSAPEWLLLKEGFL